MTSVVRWFVCMAAVALIASCVLVVLGGTPAPLLVLAVALATLALRSWLPTAVALAAVLVGSLGLLAVAMRLWPALGASLGWMLVLPAVGGAGSLVVAWRRHETSLAATRADLALGAGMAALSLVQVLAVPAARWFSGRPKLAWMMNNDNAWNLISARYIVEDGGLAPGSHRNPAPLANELVSLFLVPGRADVARTGLLSHDLLRASQVLLLLVAAVSLVAGLVVASRIPASRPWSRAVLAVTAAVIPWTWSLAGHVFVFGFWNSLPTAVLLLGVWAAWVASERSPVVGSGLLALSATGLLAAWAPLALVPLAFALVVVAWHWRRHLALRGRAALAWLTPWVVLASYAVVVTGADYAASSEGLTMEGSFPGFGEHLPLVFWLAPLGALLLLRWGTVRTELVGVLVLGVAGGAGILYLMGQRAGSPAGPWGYYPQKFAWSLSLLAPVVVLGAARGLLGEEMHRVQRGAAVLGTMLLTGALLLQVPPFDLRPLAARSYPIAHRTPDYRVTSVLPVVSIMFPDRASAMDPAARSLLALEDPDRKVVVSRWSPDPGANGFINFWLLQLPVDQAREHPHDYAYGLDSFDPAQLCNLARDWGSGILIHTRDPELSDDLERACPASGFEVRVG